MQRDLLDRLAAHPRIARILRARIITDLVSFCDCLVTRPVSPGAPQAMDGLEKLIARQRSIVGPDRQLHCRLKLSGRAPNSAGHSRQHRCPSRNRRCLYDLISPYGPRLLRSRPRGFSFYERVVAAFTKTCHSILFLRMYAADGRRLYGVSTSRAPAACPTRATISPARPLRQSHPRSMTKKRTVGT